ncbi:MAG: DUF1592 domain-containing protein [Bryobacterales bacterium]|nr:DUF1592 domain-containing protein [Bryobacterales bacterium]
MRLAFAILALWLPLQAVDETYFAETVYPILAKKNCRGCHTEGGVAAGTRLRFPGDGGAVGAFGRSLTALVNRDRPGDSVLLGKPTGRVKHTGGRLIEPGSAEEEALAAWVSYLAKLPPQAAAEPPVAAAPVHAPVMRRLTHSQYNNTVRDLLGDQTRPADGFPPEDFVHGFKNQREAQSVPPLLAEAYASAAERLARNAFRGGDTQGLIPCQPAGAADRACAARFVAEFGIKAYRRPLSARETERLVTLLLTQASAEGGFIEGARAVVETMLQSPNFLFLVERGEHRGHELASRMSYFLWDSMPDAPLFADAASGALETVPGVERAARRMLDHTKAQEAFDEFLGQWLRFDRVLGTVKDRRLYPQFTPEVAAAMVEETRLLARELAWRDGNFMDLFTARYSFLNSDLARLYKLPEPPSEFARMTFPEDTDRAGILGHASFLAMSSKPAETSPTIRGIFIREQFLCQQVPDPPPGTNGNLPEVTPDKPRTNRDRLKEHVANPVCAGCHNLIDPVGFGFEKFDAIGQKRDELILKFLARPGQDGKVPKQKEVRLPLDTSGSVAGIPGGERFSNPRQLGEILAASEQCQDCVAKQVFRYAMGRRETAADAAALREMSRAFRESQFRWKRLIMALITSDAFRAARS